VTFFGEPLMQKVRHTSFVFYDQQFHSRARFANTRMAWFNRKRRNQLKSRI